MGFFFKALAAIVIGDAIGHRRPTKYWYPNRPGLPWTGTHIPYVVWTPPRAPQQRHGRPAGWDPQSPERP